ncbi:MAG: uracil-DNA glycosylase family protein [Ahrensia sp.]|nr:uracil-DNA glycosylase family protein [Ahrensia sp.]
MPDVEEAIKQLQRNIEACHLCITNPIKGPLPHEPRPVVRLSSTARLCIAGQAPGLRVHESGIPFDDRSGDRLRQWMGLDRDQFYDRSKLAIVPMGFCFPGYNASGSDLPPRKECQAAWHDLIFIAMPQIELVLTIGQYAQAYHLGSNKAATVTDTVRSWRKVMDRASVPRFLPLPHPSWRNTGWLKKNPWFETDLLPVLRSEVRRLMKSSSL